jgi:hypothetical protein
MGTWTLVAGLYIYFPNQVSKAHFFSQLYDLPHVSRRMVVEVILT